VDAVRLFVGIPMAAAVMDQLAALRARLERQDDGLRWPAPESWHITLQFLGATMAPQYDCLLSHLRAIVAGPVPIKLEGLGFFERVGVFFVGVPVSPELITLQESVVAATSQCGFKAEDRRYHPHITLARNRGREDGVRGLKPRVGPSPEFAGFVAHEFLLYESFLSSQGSRYGVRARFPLEGPKQK
jgi:RNA 2',3'-cyclic 3'-phosphodiesterase